MRSLCMTMDKRWTFNNMMKRIVTNMQLIRNKCYNLVTHSKYPMSMDIIYYFINQTSMALINYGGSTSLILAQNITDIRNEYNRTIKIMNERLHTISIIESCNFNGFRSFDALLFNVNAKAFIRIITANKYTAIYGWRDGIFKEIKNWQQQQLVQVNKDDINKLMPKNRKNDPLWAHYMAAHELQITDLQTYQHEQYVPRNSIPYISINVPICIQIVPYNSPWTEEYVQPQDIMIAIDGSVQYEEGDANGNVRYKYIIRVMKNQYSQRKWRLAPEPI